MATTTRAVYLDEDELSRFIARKAPVIVVVSAAWCFPCRQLAPIVRKLAAEFGIPLAFLDGDTATKTNEAYRIGSFPQMLFFRNGELAGLHGGFHDPADTRQAVCAFLGRQAEEGLLSGEEAFQQAWRKACARTEEIMGPSQEALRPHIEAVTPALEAAISTIRDELEAGRIGRKEANVRRNSERDRFYAPFADKIRALREAQDLALAAYEEIINEATDRFVRDAGVREVNMVVNASRAIDEVQVICVASKPMRCQSRFEEV